MTQTPSRDWQKDEALLQLCQRTAADENEKHALSIGLHWLQEAKTLQDKLKELVEIIEYEADLADLRGAENHARELRAMVSTLYPDTPAPTNEEV
jgi:hypothetical protein